MVRFHAALFPQRLLREIQQRREGYVRNTTGNREMVQRTEGYVLSPVKTGLIISPTFRRSRWMDTGN